MWFFPSVSLQTPPKKGHLQTKTHPAKLFKPMSVSLGAPNTGRSFEVEPMLWLRVFSGVFLLVSLIIIMIVLIIIIIS